MPKKEWGVKRVCPETGKRFYDLNREPVISPYTGMPISVEAENDEPEIKEAEDGAKPGGVEVEGAVQDDGDSLNVLDEDAVLDDDDGDVSLDAMREAEE